VIDQRGRDLLKAWLTMSTSASTCFWLRS
jgi:hypothetical protein